VPKIVVKIASLGREILGTIGLGLNVFCDHFRLRGVDVEKLSRYSRASSRIRDGE